MRTARLHPSQQETDDNATPILSTEFFDVDGTDETMTDTINSTPVEKLYHLPNNGPGVSDYPPIKPEHQETIRLDGVSSSIHHSMRQRLVVEVLVPTWTEVKRKREVEEEDFKKLKKMKNPMVKKIKNMDLLLDTVKDRLKPIGLDLYDITLDKVSQEVRVSRDFMSATYGGSMQATRPKIGKRLLAIHGMDDFVYLNPDYQPEAPQVPGAPGLFFGTEAGGDWHGVQRALTRIESNEWQFMGMYEINTCASLTEGEWAAQPPKVRSTWARQICLQGWGLRVCVRVRARKDMGREPTEKDYNDILESKRYRATTPEEVMCAYDKGEERLGVWTMKCVGYDNVFQLQLCEKFPNWVSPPRKPRNSRKDTNKSTKSRPSRANKTSTTRRHERKRSELPESESTEPESEDSEDDNRSKKEEMNFLEVSDDEAEEELIYKNKGTRSRPIYL